MKLAVVADEIGTTLEEQIKSMKLANIKYIEMRKVNDKYLWEYSKDELKKFKQVLDENDIEVITLDSPVGKKPFPYERKMELFDIYLDISKIFNNKYIRIFSNIGRELEETEIRENLKRLCEKAKKENIELLMENERATLAESPVDCARLMENIDNINIIYDLSNAFLENHKVFEAYENSKERITYIHLRDYDLKKEKYAHLGEGDIGIKEFMKTLKKDGFNGFVSIETHLPMNNSGETKQDLFLKSMKNFYKLVEEFNITIN